MANPSRKLPEWARVQQPIYFDEAAATLGVSRRKLTDILREFQSYEKRGNKKVFYPENIMELRKCLNSKQKAAGTTYTELPQMGNALEKLLKLVTEN